MRTWILVLSLLLIQILARKYPNLLAKPSEILVANPPTLDLLVGNKGSVEFEYKGDLKGNLTVYLAEVDEVFLSSPVLFFDSLRKIQQINVTAKEITSRVFVSVDHCVGPCPFDPSTVYLQLTVYRSVIARFLVQLTGWGYFFAWSISFYPQMLMNYRRKSVQGLNFDFLLLNLIGFTAYSVYNLAMYYSPSVQSEYLNENPRAQIPVLFNDVFFAIHAFGACVVTAVQCLIYDKGNQSLSKSGMALSAILTSTGFISIIILLIGLINSLRFITILSYVKMVVTCSKYFPQALFNYRRQSTVGWSIGNLLLDFTGGSLSILQMVIQSWNTDDWSAFTGNVVKFGLGLVSMVFDILFFVQHYCLYRNRDEIVTILNDDPTLSPDDLPIVEYDSVDQQHQESH